MAYAQALDLTLRLDDCLPPDHLARFVVHTAASKRKAISYERLIALAAHLRVEVEKLFAWRVELSLLEQRI
ncbi:MAG: hypothetical protein NVS4B7_08920 [Ktedonobacteraceae bacterium]